MRGLAADNVERKRRPRAGALPREQTAGQGVRFVVSQVMDLGHCHCRNRRPTVQLRALAAGFLLAIANPKAWFAIAAVFTRLDADSVLPRT